MYLKKNYMFNIMPKKKEQSFIEKFTVSREEIIIPNTKPIIKQR